MFNWFTLSAAVIVGGLAITGPIFDTVKNMAAAIEAEMIGGDPETEDFAAKWIVVGE